MGANLALNLAEKGHGVAVYNRTWDVTEHFLNGTDARGFGVMGARNYEELASMLSRPRVVLLMVTAGRPVDSVITDLLPHLEEGDIMIDAGNANFRDTMRRFEALQDSGLTFIGMGVSGGEEGARHGP